MVVLEELTALVVVLEQPEQALPVLLAEPDRMVVVVVVVPRAWLLQGVLVALRVRILSGQEPFPVLDT